MKRSVFACVLALALLLAGCGGTRPAPAEAAVPETTLPSPTPTPAPTPTPEPTPTPKPPLTDGELAAFVEEAAEHHGAVGVQAAVIEDGTVTAQAAWGWATLNSAPMTTDHKLRVASLTKVVVGMCAMLLSEDGTVTLDAPIGTWWDTTSVNPWYPDTPVTIDTLLTHTSSLAASDSLSARTYSGARSRIGGSGYRAVEPGDPAGWAYNNYGFAVLGMTLELAADTSLDYMLAEGLLDPLGIDAAFEGGSVDNTDLLATLYYYGGSLARSTSEQRSYTLDYAPGHKGNFFDGGFTCSAGDLAKLAAVLANDGAYEGQVLLSPESVAWMETPLDTPVSDGRSTFLQCRPLRYQEELYGRDGLYYHTGSAYGQYALLSYDPDTGDGVVVLTSGADGVVDEHGIYAICGEIAQAVYAAVEEDT